MTDYAGLLAISATGMRAERMRLEVASQNLANVHSVVGPQDQPYRPMRVVPHAVESGMFEQKLSGADHLDGLLRGVERVDVVPTGGEPSLDHDPGNPLADDKGMVRVPRINVADEMLTVLTSVRAYEADVRAMNAAKSIALRALDIGSSRA